MLSTNAVWKQEQVPGGLNALHDAHADAGSTRRRGDKAVRAVDEPTVGGPPEWLTSPLWRACREIARERGASRAATTVVAMQGTRSRGEPAAFAAFYLHQWCPVLAQAAAGTMPTWGLGR